MPASMASRPNGVPTPAIMARLMAAWMSSAHTGEPRRGLQRPSRAKMLFSAPSVE